MYYNTNNLTGSALKAAKQKAISQEETIHRIMKGKGWLTPFEVHKIFKNRFSEIPITSVRRTLTDLVNLGKAMKSKDLTMEKYGRPNYKWKAI